MRGRFVAYYRVSTDKQGKSGLGLDAQRKAVRDFLDGGAWELVGEFEETESGKDNDRPELAKAIAVCKRQRARLIIAKLDRLSRNLAFIATKMESRVRFVCADMPEADETMLHMMGVMAHWERKQISRRTKEALAAAKARGVKLGDYARISRAKAAATRARAETVRKSIEQTAGLSANAAAAALNARGVKTAAGGAWQAGQVLRARRHLGV